jgi:hypothetical protein
VIRELQFQLLTVYPNYRDAMNEVRLPRNEEIVIALLEIAAGGFSVLRERNLGKGG